MIVNHKHSNYINYKINLLTNKPQYYHPRQYRSFGEFYLLKSKTKETIL